MTTCHSAAFAVKSLVLSNDVKSFTFSSHFNTLLLHRFKLINFCLLFIVFYVFVYAQFTLLILKKNYNSKARVYNPNCSKRTDADLRNAKFDISVKFCCNTNYEKQLRQISRNINN